MKKPTLLWIGLAFSIVVVIVGSIINGQGQGSSNGLIGAGVGLIFTGAFCVLLFTSCLAWDGVVKCFQGCCGGGVGITGGINTVTNNDNPAGLQLQGGIVLRPLPLQRPLPAAPQTIVVQPQQPQSLVVGTQNLRVVGNNLVDERGNVVAQLIVPTVPVASSSVIMTPQYLAQQQFQQLPSYNTYK